MENLKTKKLGVSEYQLTLEEEKRGCTPAILGHTITQDMRKLPGILLKQPLKNRDKYADKTANSWWKLLDNRGIVEAVFLVMEFEGVGTIEICIDQFTTTKMDWFKLLVASNGELALSDTTNIKVKGITVPNVPLDIPLLLVEKASYYLDIPP
ncbi:MAG: hypothetical protein A2W22_02965 [Candidatus Levybacteria bacterium RBG_16_35_11]|nr:MAG: hypothetical protein A2W22_02965 [Candidatus Levybacteria bacterium RBG_16_35_11]